MLAMEKVARKNEDEDDDDDQHHNEDDVQVHGGYSGSHHHFSDLQMASVFPDCVVHMAVVGAYKYSTHSQKPKSQIYMFVVFGIKTESFDGRSMTVNRF